MWRVLLLLTVITLTCVVGKGSVSFTSGFPSLKEVRGNGSLLDRVYGTHDAEWRHFHNLTFNCTGRITKLTFIALPEGGSNAMNIRVAKEGINIGSQQLDHENTSRFGLFGYASTLNVSFEPGDTFSIMQTWTDQNRYRLLYKSGVSKQYVCWCFRDSPQNCGWVDDYPLMAIETDPPGCAQGSLDEALLKKLWSNRTSPVLYHGLTSVLRFNCTPNTTISVHKLKVGAYLTGENIGNSNEIRFRGKSGVMDNCALSQVNATANLNVWECNTPGAVVQNEDYITVRVRAGPIKVYLTHNGMENTALISMDLGNNCTGPFTSEKELLLMAKNIPNFAQAVEGHTIYPNMIITQDGQLVRWTFTAEDQGMGEGRIRYPELQVYRINTNVFTLPESNKVVPTAYPNVYECVPDHPLSVKAGDYVTVLQPPEHTARLLLSFVGFAGPRGLPTNVRRKRAVWPLPGKEGNLPLITLEIITPTSKPIPSSSSFSKPITDPSYTGPNVDPTSRPTDRSAVTVTPEIKSSAKARKSNVVVVIASVVATVLFVLILAVLVILLVLVIMKRKKRFVVKEREKNGGAIPMDNPIYSGTDEKVNERVSSANDDVCYQCPNDCYDQDNSELYDLPQLCGQGTESDQSKAFDNPAYYASIPDLHSAPDVHSTTDATTTMELTIASPNHYEMGLYVPTQEQRQCVAGCMDQVDESIYSTLGETQITTMGRSLVFFEECEVYWRPASSRDELYAQLARRRYREIPRHQIQTTNHLGSGQFGTVNLGVWQCQQTAVEVAVKMLQPGAPEEDAVRFLQEAAIMGQFRHPNIVQLLGVVTVGKPVMIVLELLGNGDLRNYLLKHKPVRPGELPPSDTPQLLSQFCLQVALGMEYLSRKAFVHRDLAARNILVTKKKTCKISDFGMSRDLEDGTYYISHGGKIPVKWTAPEALHFKKYSTASDVWSFGCLMYEIWSLGHKPFEGYTNPDTIGLVDAGSRLAPPPGCPQEIYRLMILCWHPDKASRPTFSAVVAVLSTPPHSLLSVPEEEGRVHPQAALLGAPLEAGRDLYLQLQETYL